ncbi:MAG TPA: D-alanyl-D-alanine carboxypeptidase [Pseudolabrys sp.]
MATLIVATAATTEANARAHRRHHHRPAASSSDTYQPSYASIVVDANTGTIMQETNADSPRHPASITKIMTLYMLFERLASGKMTLNTELPVSAHAAAQAPSKLGLKPGDSIKVESAIRGIVTRSANDVAVVIGEAIGGDETNFGRMMTAKARSLGMNHTFYHNASGLPDDQQITTARDQSILARAIQDRFPQYYHYFSTPSFVFRGNVIRNHNHLLGRVPGLDGMKTGYIRASGFNIVTSVRRGGRHIIAVVFGGSSASARDARVVSLIDGNINVASIKRTAPPLAEGVETADADADVPEVKETRETKVAAVAPAPVETPPAVAAPPLAPAPSRSAEVQQPEPGSTDPIKPNPVKTFTVRAAGTRTASLSAPAPDSRKLAPSPAAASLTNVTTVSTVKAESTPLPPPPGARPGVLGVLPANKVASAGDSVPVTASTAEASAKRNGGWMIQVGAFDDESDAKQRLNTCQSKAKDQLGKADPFTERVAKGEKSMFRARFAGLEKDQAEAACKHLKRSDIPCMLLKN